MAALNTVFAVLQPVFFDFEVIKGVVPALPSGQDLTLHDLHDFTALILQLLGEHHDGECLGDQIHEGIVGHLVLTLAEGDHTPPCSLG